MLPRGRLCLLDDLAIRGGERVELLFREDEGATLEPGGHGAHMIEAKARQGHMNHGGGGDLEVTGERRSGDCREVAD